MGDWNLADVLEQVARQVPGSPVLIQGDRRITWGDFDARATALASFLVSRGLPRQAKVAQYLRNCPEYVESVVASLKAAMVPMNTNFRYAAEELEFLWRSGEAEAVVFAEEFSELAAHVREHLPEVRAWIWVRGGEGDRCPDWAVDYDEIVDEWRGKNVRLHERSGDDLVLLFTGGTTGLPKGVMWRQDDLFVTLTEQMGKEIPAVMDLDWIRARIRDNGHLHVPAAPLMHGAGLFPCLTFLARGGGLVLLEGHTFSAAELLDVIEREAVFSVGWVGDAFALPTVEMLEENPQRWDLSSWRVLISGGVRFSPELKRRLLNHVPGLTISDSMGASEALSIGQQVSKSQDSLDETAGTFTLKDRVIVIREDGSRVPPGTGEAGLLAIGGRMPVGYYKTEDKASATFRIIDGERYSVPGDWALVDADGHVVILGRGSECINTGGEKVFPDEVEGVLLLHPGIREAAVVGAKDSRFGEQVIAVIVADESCEVDDAAIIAHAKDHLAHYKAPRQIVRVDALAKTPAGKTDRVAIRELAQSIV